MLQNAGIERFDVESFLAPDLVIVLGGPIGVYELIRDLSSSCPSRLGDGGRHDAIVSMFVVIL